LQQLPRGQHQPIGETDRRSVDQQSKLPANPTIICGHAACTWTLGRGQLQASCLARAATFGRGNTTMADELITRSEFVEYMQALEDRLTRQMERHVTSLREAADRNFGELRGQHDQQTSLLRTAVRQRIELERRRA
jgi:hypothetical protein